MASVMTMKSSKNGKGLLVVFVLVLALGYGTAWAEPHETLFELYENNRREGVGNYITEDFILLSHSLMLSETFAEIEEQVLLPNFREFVAGMLAVLREKDGESQVTKGNVEYFLLLEALLLNTPVAEVREQAVARELAVILRGEGIDTSGLMDQQIDYSRFKPRGRYTRSEAMACWFRAMTWAGSAYFPLVASKATGISEQGADHLTARALEIAGVLQQNKTLAGLYLQMDNQLGKVFGNVEDMTWTEYAKTKPDGGKSDVPGLRKKLYKAAKDSGRIGRIHDGIVMVDQLEKGLTSGDVLCGMRLFPRRYSPDSAALQRLVYPEVGAYGGDKGQALPFTATTIGADVVKGFPRALELMGLLGSKAAEKEIARTHDTLYKNYQKSWKEAGKELANPPGLAVNTSLMRDWLSKGTVVDSDRRQNTMLGYWTWGRYVSLLFTKQSVTGTSKSLQIPAKRTAASLQPATALYLRIRTDMLALQKSLGKASPDIEAKLSRYLDLLNQLITLSKTVEKQGVQLNAAQIEVLNNLDTTLYAIIGAKDQPIVVDVHTEPQSKQAVQEATGFARRVSHIEAGQKLRGALFTHYEFKQPMANRLTDETWLKELTAPCSLYFPGAGKLVAPDAYLELCRDEKKAKIIVTLKEAKPAATDKGGSKAQAKKLIDSVLDGLEGFELSSRLENSAIFSGAATVEAIRILAGRDEVRAIEPERQLTTMEQNIGTITKPAKE